MAILKRNKTDLPNKLEDLIKYLDESFPLKNPEPTDCSNQIMYRSGQRSVIDFLKSKLNQENNN
tara:strand:- start:1163 stop:1354 length:192 start_codon:yes stop_codon:yes gene_type:complete